ncbi:MAG: TIGR02147 family protein [Deltaproteobacteria bacterium]|nr:TIGR02147 family protein [Deltaproteobacteria bacterium]
MAAGPDVFEFLDYRAFLREHYEAKKASGRFSYRAFSRRAGLGSPNYLKLVIDGERNLSSEMAARFATACGLDGNAAAYFQDLVAFNQAKNAEEKNAAYRRLTGFRRYRSVHRLEMAHAEYHSTWYLPAIRELAARTDFEADPEWIASRLRPPIPRADAARALDTLLELGLLVRDDDGHVRQGEPIVSTGPEMHALHIANYHRMMIQRGAASIEDVPSAERDISALTLCLAPDGLAELKRRLQAFRRELLDLSAEETDPEVVVQLNMQLFPLSRAETE